MQAVTGLDVTAQTAITDREFQDFQAFIFRLAGISLSAEKKALVTGRLAKRLRHYNLPTYGEYFRLVASGSQPAETQILVDLLTTNETYFFRESKHFEFLRREVLPHVCSGSAFRAWSAASSSGEEAYSIAMTLADVLGSGPWEVFGSDISSRMIEAARAAHYPLERAKQVERHFLVDYCLKGVGSQEGTFLIGDEVKRRVRFQQVNLNKTLPDIGSFDVIFLRNVMIYFNPETKRQVVTRVVEKLKRGGYFLIGHSESLNGITDGLIPVAASVYRKP